MNLAKFHWVPSDFEYTSSLSGREPVLLRGPVKGREAEKHFGRAPGVPNSSLESNGKDGLTGGAIKSWNPKCGSSNMFYFHPYLGTHIFQMGGSNLMQKLYGNFEEIWLEGGTCHGHGPPGMQSSPVGLFAPPVFEVYRWRKNGWER